jgi:hypothetical protein
MPRKSTDAVKRKADPAEADWYLTAQGRLQTNREFTRAPKEGKLIRSTGAKTARSDHRILEQLMEEAKRNATRSISIRVPIADLNRRVKSPKKPVSATKPCSSKPSKRV